MSRPVFSASRNADYHTLVAISNTWHSYLHLTRLIIIKYLCTCIITTANLATCEDNSRRPDISGTLRDHLTPIMQAHGSLMAKNYLHAQRESFYSFICTVAAAAFTLICALVVIISVMSWNIHAYLEYRRRYEERDNYISSSGYYYY